MLDHMETLLLAFFCTVFHSGGTVCNATGSTYGFPFPHVEGKGFRTPPRHCQHGDSQATSYNLTLIPRWHELSFTSQFLADSGGKLECYLPIP